MNLVTLPWAAVVNGSLIVGPSGRIWLCHHTAPMPPNGRPGVRLTDPEGIEPELVFGVDPSATTTVIQPADHTRRALEIIARVFPHLELIG